MTKQRTQTEEVFSAEHRHRAKIRNRIISILALMGVIMVLFSFLVNYKGFSDWEQIDTNLTIFVAVNVNIVLLTTVFYLILRNLFKLIYERRQPMAGMSLRAKLIVAFVALSLPSTAFHLMASGFMAFIFENWSQGEYKRLLESTEMVTEELSRRDEQLLRRKAEEVLPYLPRDEARYLQEDWMGGYHPGYQGGMFVYGTDNRVIARWVSDEKVLETWKIPPIHTFESPDGGYWIEQGVDWAMQRLLVPLPGAGSLKLELFEMAPPTMVSSLLALNSSRNTSRVLRRELAPLMLTFLIVMTLLIIFAATWIAFYLARGFVTPIERLDDATNRVSGGELGYQVKGGSLGPLESDFMGLVKSFNAMSRQLADQRGQLVHSAQELRQSHQNLAERNRLVELLLENIDAGIIYLSPQGSVKAVNRPAWRMLQLRTDAWLDKHFMVLLPREMVDLLDELLDRLRGESKRQLSQNITLGESRKAIIMEVTLLALQIQSGEPEGTVVMLKDVTSLQKHQRALAWREVARRVAHEIKNPLTPIQLSAQRLRRKYLAEMKDEGVVLDQCTQTIINEVTSLKKMVNEFSQFAKLPDSKPVQGDLNAVIQEVMRLYANSVPDTVNLKLELDKDLPLFPLDREQIKRVFTNLMDNAISALNGGGTVRVGTSFDKGTQTVMAEVEDDGSGIPESVRSRMFEPYTSTKEGGTGLGLTIVNQIISDHNGYIRFTDRKPRGTIFTMEFRLN
ncbi:MAG: ATP-binding protein [Deltaproteobacteria bacterium]|nr:ATP-binding protein [Deltaproteobacteria bacterium]